ncbi:hypothetical protein O1611_g5205 [Lasiodiplodia mahajangana]|uniref:Uncharacterized protein n=1 Tax=Lasiodiplodia mahajangana TaxID=1108764 RepID=A0ACC2JM05_9PEZI|nr:hypothetical protein O1611_g5205 [Lasiodiplodia mahajangana]
MSFQASNSAQRLEHGLWCALTRLDGFDFPPDPLLRGAELKNFSKVMIGKSSWRHLTQGDLVIRVTAIFEAACSVYESENDPLSNGAFYASVAKKASKTKFKDHDIFRQVIETYTDGLKRVATRSEGHVYVDRRSAPACLSVASWIELTQDINISITTKKPNNAHNDIAPEQKSRKRRAEDAGDDRAYKEAKARKVELEKAIAERQQTYQNLEKIYDLTQKFEAMKYKYSTQATRLANAEQDAKAKATELKDAKAKHERLLKAIKAAQRDRDDTIANLKRQYDDHATKHFAMVETEWKNATWELALVKKERDQARETLADCAELIKSLNSKLNGGNGGA